MQSKNLSWIDGVVSIATPLVTCRVIAQMVLEGEAVAEGVDREDVGREDVDQDAEEDEKVSIMIILF